MGRRLLGIMLVVVVASGCGSAPAAPSATTPSPAPTPALTPALTLPPSAAPPPSATPVPPPAPTPYASPSEAPAALAQSVVVAALKKVLRLKVAGASWAMVTDGKVVCQAFSGADRAGDAGAALMCGLDAADLNDFFEPYVHAFPSSEAAAVGYGIWEKALRENTSFGSGPFVVHHAPVGDRSVMIRYRDAPGEGKCKSKFLAQVDSALLVFSLNGANPSGGACTNCGRSHLSHT